MDSYDVFDECDNVVFKIKGQFSFGHCLVIYDCYGNELGMLKEKIFSFRPCFYMYINGEEIGTIRKAFTFFKPEFNLDCNGWSVVGDFFEWEYGVYEGNRQIMQMSKAIFNLSDTYVIDIANPNHALAGLMIALAIDAEKCSRND